MSGDGGPPGSDSGASVAGVWGDDDGSTPPNDSEHPFGVPAAGRYERGPLLGAGGMGQVFATHDKRLRRDVARKEVTPAAGSAGAARLAQEAWITAQLEHPGIVAVYDAGTHEDGTPWYTMRLVRGRTLSDAVGVAGPDDKPALLRHLLAATEAVAYAHSRGIIHRDLKPENILVGEFGETQVADWGLARPVDRPDRFRSGGGVGGTSPGATVAGAVLGTPAYMSPEQVRGEPATKQSDVWSLGATLREVMTGRALYGGSDADATLRERVLGDGSAALGPFDGPPAMLAILERALAVDPADRYPDAAALADDLGRYLDGRRVRAHTYSAAELLARLVTLWRAPLAVAAVALLILGVVVVVAWVRTAREQDRALAAEIVALENQRRSEASLSTALVAQARTAEERGDRARAETLALAALEGGDLPAARGVLVGVDRGPRPELLGAGRPVDCEWVSIGDPAGTWLCVRGLSVFGLSPAGDVRWERRLPEQPLTAPLGEGRFAVWYHGSALSLIDARDGRTVDEAPLDPSLFPQWVVPSPDGSELLLGRGPAWRLLDLRSKTLAPLTLCRPGVVGLSPMWLEGHPAMLCGDSQLAIGRRGAVVRRTLQGAQVGRSAARAAPWGPDGLVVTTDFGEVSILDRGTGALQSRFQVGEHPMLGIATDFERGVVAIRGDRGDVSLWRPGSETAVVLPTMARRLAFDDVGELVLIGDRHERWRLPAGLQVHRMAVPAGLSSIAVSPDRATAVGVRGDGNLSVWALEAGTVTSVAVRPGVVLKDGTYAPEGRFGAVTAVAENGLMWFDGSWGADEAGGPGAYRRVAALADGSVVLLDYTGRGPLRQRPDGGITRLEWPGEFWDLSVSPSGRRFVIVGEVADVRRVIAAELTETGIVRRAEVEVDEPRAVAIDDAGAFFATVPGGVREFLPDGTPGLDLRAGLELPTSAAVSPSGDLVAVGDLTGGIWIWNRRTGALLAEVRGHAARVSGLAFRSERELVSGSWDATMRRWSMRSLRRDVEALRADLGPWALSVSDALSDPR